MKKPSKSDSKTPNLTIKFQLKPLTYVQLLSSPPTQVVIFQTFLYKNSIFISCLPNQTTNQAHNHTLFRSD